MKKGNWNVVYELVNFTINCRKIHPSWDPVKIKGDNSVTAEQEYVLTENNITIDWFLMYLSKGNEIFLLII